MPTVTAQLSTVDLCESYALWVANRGGIDAEILKQGTYSVFYQSNKSTITTATWTPISAVNWSSYTSPHLYWTHRCDVMPFAEAFNSSTTNSGLMLEVQTDASNYVRWHVAGSDTWDGGWRTFVFDVSNTSQIRASAGTLNLASVSKVIWYTDLTNSGSIRIVDNTWIDAVRVGEGLSVRSTTTETVDFGDIADADGNSSNWYGVCQRVDGILFAQGKITIGDGTNSVYFNSSGEVVVFRDRVISSDHYEIVANAGAASTNTIAISGLTCICLGSTGAELDFSDTDIDSASIAGSQFTGMGAVDLTMVDVSTTKFVDCGAVTLGSGMDAIDCTFDGCGQVTQGGADMSGSTVENYAGTADTGAVYSNETTTQEANMEGMTFIKGTTSAHAVQFGSSIPAKVILENCTFSGYNASDNQTDSTFYFDDTSGTFTLELLSCTGNFTVKTAGCTVNVVLDTVTTRVYGRDASTGTGIQGARVFLAAADGTGDLPYDLSVTSLVQAAGTAYATTATAHGLVAGDYAVIEGAVPSGYNGAREIVTAPTTTTFTYSCDSGLTTPATGTKTVTGAIFNDTTNEFGYVSDVRSFTTDQPVTGYVRKSTSTPRYKSGIAAGTISATAGLVINVYLVADE